MDAGLYGVGYGTSKGIFFRYESCCNVLKEKILRIKKILKNVNVNYMDAGM